MAPAPSWRLRDALRSLPPPLWLLGCSRLPPSLPCSLLLPCSLSGVVNPTPCSFPPCSLPPCSLPPPLCPRPPPPLLLRGLLRSLSPPASPPAAAAPLEGGSGGALPLLAQLHCARPPSPPAAAAGAPFGGRAACACALARASCSRLLRGSLPRAGLARVRSGLGPCLLGLRLHGSAYRALPTGLCLQGRGLEAGAAHGSALTRGPVPKSQPPSASAGAGVYAGTRRAPLLATEAVSSARECRSTRRTSAALPLAARTHRWRRSSLAGLGRGLGLG